jgi:ABC-type Fe3+-hydroxamate transport system substrate-binding protein
MAIRIRDDMGRDVCLFRAPQRVVSLVPSETDNVVALGAGERLVGRTSYCTEPAGRVEGIPVVGGTKDADVEAILEAGPELVLANQEENSRATLEALAARGVPVFVSFPRRVADGIAHLARLARLLGLRGEEGATRLIRRGYEAVADAERQAQQGPRVRVFLPIWMDPLMTANEGTHLHDALLLAGAENVFADRERRYPLAADLARRSPIPADRLGDRDTRYPRISLEEVEARAPELVLLPDEPHAFTDADAEVFRGLRIPAADRGAIRFCSGKDLMWPGARAIEGIARIQALVRAEAD